MGPFDYDQENLTNMLWVSEGLSVYYQDLILVRAGMMTQDQYLAKMSGAIGSFENSPGHRYQSATESSQNTWNAGSGIGGDRNTTISYYNNGAMLGAMLDLRIREGSGNRKSLDDVMRGLYQKYYLDKKRGFTEAEFRGECENAAGTDLNEIFDYASTTKEVDYPKYFALAGLKLDATSEEAPGGLIGLHTRTQEIPPNEMPPAAGGRGGGRGNAPAIRLMVTDVAANTPAAAAGIKPGARIVDVEGNAATPSALNNAIAAKKPGEKLALRVSSGGAESVVAVEIAPNAKKTYRLAVLENAPPAQTRILADWLRKDM
jgi:predicted metalloprotease with PDZ domain